MDDTSLFQKCFQYNYCMYWMDNIITCYIEIEMIRERERNKKRVTEGFC